jgi:hypothetical protein
MRTLLYAFACVAIPSVWALTMFHAFGYWERRRKVLLSRRADDDQQLPPIDYMI